MEAFVSKRGGIELKNPFSLCNRFFNRSALKTILCYSYVIYNYIIFLIVIFKVEVEK